MMLRLQSAVNVSPVEIVGRGLRGEDHMSPLRTFIIITTLNITVTIGVTIAITITML